MARQANALDRISRALGDRKNENQIAFLLAELPSIAHLRVEEAMIAEVAPQPRDVRFDPVFVVHALSDDPPRGTRIDPADQLAVSERRCTFEPHLANPDPGSLLDDVDNFTATADSVLLERDDDVTVSTFAVYGRDDASALTDREHVDRCAHREPDARQ